MRMFTTQVLGKTGGEVLATAELLAIAAAAEGRPAAFMSTTSPDAALCMIDGWTGAPQGLPPMTDALIVQDPDEARRADAIGGLSPDAYVLVNATCGFGDLGLAEQVGRLCRDRTLILPVTRLARDSSDEVIRSSVIGGFAALCPVVSLDSVASAIEDREPGDLALACVDAAAAAYEFVRAEKEALAA